MGYPHRRVEWIPRSCVFRESPPFGRRFLQLKEHRRCFCTGVPPDIDVHLVQRNGALHLRLVEFLARIYFQCGCRVGKCEQVLSSAKMALTLQTLLLPIRQLYRLPHFWVSRQHLGSRKRYHSNTPYYRRKTPCIRALLHQPYHPPRYQILWIVLKAYYRCRHVPIPSSTIWPSFRLSIRSRRM